MMINGQVTMQLWQRTTKYKHHEAANMLKSNINDEVKKLRKVQGHSLITQLQKKLSLYTKSKNNKNVINLPN